MLPNKAIQKLQRGQTVVEKYNLVTIFYVDVVGVVVGVKMKHGSTSAESVMAMLNHLYLELDKIAKRHGVYKV